jgi:hypothetical protein
VRVNTPREKARLERVFAWVGLDMLFLGCFEVISLAFADWMGAFFRGCRCPSAGFFDVHRA